MHFVIENLDRRLGQKTGGKGSQSYGRHGQLREQPFL